MRTNLAMWLLLQGCPAEVDWIVEGSDPLTDTSTPADSDDLQAVVLAPAVVGGVISTTIERHQSLVPMDRLAVRIDEPEVVEVDDRTDLYKRSELVLRLIGEGDATVVVEGPRFDASPPLRVSARIPDIADTSLVLADSPFMDDPIGTSGLHLLDGTEVVLKTVFLADDLGALTLRDGVVALPSGAGLDVAVKPSLPTDLELHTTVRGIYPGPLTPVTWAGEGWTRSVQVQVHSAHEVTSVEMSVGFGTVMPRVWVSEHQLKEVPFEWRDFEHAWTGTVLHYDHTGPGTSVTACVSDSSVCQTVDVPGTPYFTDDLPLFWYCGGCDHRPGGGALWAAALAWAAARRRGAAVPSRGGLGGPG